MQGIEQDLKIDPPCHPRACAIQDCIQKNGFDESKCQKQSADHAKIDALYDCCNAFYEKNGDNASTVSCPKAGLLR
ncbi:hypothetical protein E4T47_01363 [Aureobasidium subglaciale]|nr:hypothetical protein E4T43_00323 [Aureobasidium subglaciale]KAI5275798.1 hypothetical protein E4T47_01363 [Aureobasidium subglaciale]